MQGAVFTVSSPHLASKTGRRGVKSVFRLVIEAGGCIGRKVVVESTFCCARIWGHKQSGEVPTRWEKGPSGISIEYGNIGGDTHWGPPARHFTSNLEFGVAALGER